MLNDPKLPVDKDGNPTDDSAKVDYDRSTPEQVAHLWILLRQEQFRQEAQEPPEGQRKQ